MLTFPRISEVQEGKQVELLFVSLHLSGADKRYLTRIFSRFSLALNHAIDVRSYGDKVNTTYSACGVGKAVQLVYTQNLRWALLYVL